MVNYVLSFCKITAASRIFSRNFYLPLLKPLTPKDALRTFRITGKWLLGSKASQHYIPVLLNHSQKRSKKEQDYGQIAHDLMEGYSYMIPMFDSENESHRLLLDILNSKEAEGSFVYTVDDKKCNIILSAPLELAIRDGQIVDVMVSQKNDKILVKMANFKKIALEMEHYETENGGLYSGEGATSPQEEKFHHHGKFTMSIAKIFEDKERLAEEWELELKKIMSRKKKQHGEGSKEWREMIRITIKNLDWNKFEQDAKVVVDQIAEPVVEQHIGMEVEDLEKTRKVPEVINSYGISILPNMGEIPDVVNCMSNAKLYEIEAEIEETIPGVDEDMEEPPKYKIKRRVSGVKVTLSSGRECFVSGQMVKTDDGDVFVPGQTIESEFGLEYSPGFTVNMDDKPTLIKGLIMGEDNQQKPMFLPTESTITADGQLTFTTNKEERIKYKPKKKPLIKKRKQKEKSPENEEQKMETVIQEEVPKKLKKKKPKKRVQEIIIEETPPTPIVEINLDDLFEDIVPKDTIEEETLSDDVRDRERDDSSSIAQRREMEQLIKELLDDGMDDLLASIEDKKASLQQKLEELRKLKLAAGMNTVTFATLDDAEAISSVITKDPDASGKIAETLLTLVRRIAAFRDRSAINDENVENTVMSSQKDEDNFHSCTNKLQIALKAAVVAANKVFKTRPKDQVLGLKAIKNIFISELQEEKALEEFVNLAKTPLDRNEICNAVIRDLTQVPTKSKIGLLKMAVGEKVDKSLIAEKLSQIIEEEGEVMGPAFNKLCKTNPELAERVIHSLENKVRRLKTENAIIEAVKGSIVSVMLCFAQEHLTEIDERYDCDQVKEFLEESEGLAKTLGLNDASENLANMSQDPDVELCLCDRQSLIVMKRLCVIKKLAKRDYSLKNAIQKIKQNPERAKTDPRVRQLVRESAVLMSEASPLKNSKELPLQFLKTENLLAIEDFLAQRIKLDQPILITKKGMQAIIPKEATRGVLAGRVSYVLVDESGINNIRPMHMLSAIKNRDISFDDFGGSAGKSERERSQSPFLSNSRGSSPQGTDIKSRIRKSLNKSRMVA